jgi:hypothetical protein
MTAATVSAAGGKVETLEHPRETASAARLKPIVAGGRIMAACGRRLATAICSHVAWIAREESSQRKGAVDSSARGPGAAASAHPREVDGVCSERTVWRGIMVGVIGAPGETECSFGGNTGLAGGALQNEERDRAAKFSLPTLGTNRARSLCGRNIPPSGGSAGPGPRRPFHEVSQAEARGGRTSNAGTETGRSPVRQEGRRGCRNEVSIASV